MSGDLLATLARVGRLIAAESWGNGLNPVQHAALHYLARANRISRTPSAVAAYLGSTRSTVSKSLKSLVAKGYTIAVTDKEDRRSISFALTSKGLSAARPGRALVLALADLGPQEMADATALLDPVLTRLCAATGTAPFGECLTCHHHEREDGRRCARFNAPLSESEARQICQFHAFRG